MSSLGSNTITRQSLLSSRVDTTCLSILSGMAVVNLGPRILWLIVDTALAHETTRATETAPASYDSMSTAVRKKACFPSVESTLTVFPHLTAFNWTPAWSRCALHRSTATQTPTGYILRSLNRLGILPSY